MRTVVVTARCDGRIPYPAGYRPSQSYRCGKSMNANSHAQPEQSKSSVRIRRTVDGNGEPRYLVGDEIAHPEQPAPAAAERAVPVGVLRELMRDWRTRGAEGKAVREVYGWAADELEALASGGEGE